MIILYSIFLVLAGCLLAALWYFVPGIGDKVKIALSVAVFLALSVAATLWINWAAHQMPYDAQVVAPPEK